MHWTDWLPIVVGGAAMVIMLTAATWLADKVIQHIITIFG